MIIQKQYEYVCRINKNLDRKNSFERIINSKFRYPKSQDHQMNVNQHCDTVNFKAQMFYNEADKISQTNPIFEENNNPLNKMYLIESQPIEDLDSSPTKEQEDLRSIDDLNKTFVSLGEGQVVLIGDDHKNKKYQTSYQPFLSSKWTRESTYQSPVKYPPKALIPLSGSEVKQVLQIENPDINRKYLTNLKTHLIHKISRVNEEIDLKTRFEHVDNSLYKQKQSKYNPGYNEPFQVKNSLREDCPEKHFGPRFQLRFGKGEVCDQSKVSKIDDQTREEILEEIFMKSELENYLKDKEANSHRKKWNLQYKLTPITNPLKPKIIHQQNQYTRPIFDKTRFLTNEVYYDKQFEAQTNPLLSSEKQKVLGETLSHRFSNSPVVQYRRQRSMSKKLHYSRGIFDITQQNSKSLNQSFY